MKFVYVYLFSGWLLLACLFLEPDHEFQFLTGYNLASYNVFVTSEYLVLIEHGVHRCPGTFQSM